MMMFKGMAFWYTSLGKKYVGVVLDTALEEEYFLILFSDCIKEINHNIIVENLPVYTVAWFHRYDILHFPRVHIISSNLKIDKQYNGLYGGFFSQSRVVVTNCGQTSTWKHKFRQYYENKIIRDFL